MPVRANQAPLAARLETLGAIAGVRPAISGKVGEYAGIPVVEGMFLRSGRAHEITGPGAVGFAAAMAGRSERAVFWIGSTGLENSLCWEGLRSLLLPERCTLAQVSNQKDALWTSEEALRCPAGLAVIASFPKPLGLTPSRRLQLAAEEGGGIGLFIVPENGGATAAETRWHCISVAGPPGTIRWRWTLVKNKSGTTGVWEIDFHAPTGRFGVVSATGDGSPAARDENPERLD